MDELGWRDRGNSWGTRWKMDREDGSGMDSPKHGLHMEATGLVPKI